MAARVIKKKSSSQRDFLCRKLRISLGLVYLSRIPSGAFLREEAYPGSEMASQNDQNKEAK